STTTISSSVNPAIYGQNVTFSATVTPSAATGTVEFFDGTTSLGSVAMSSGAATLATSNLSAGTHSITARYSGDSDLGGSVSAPLTETVDKASTTTTISSSLNPSSYSQNVTITATLSPSSATGTVEFFDGAVLIGSAAVSAGSASLSTSSLSVGSHSITVSYAGDSNFNGSASTPLAAVVNKASSTTTISSSVNPSSYGQNVTVTATVTPSSATGAVEFFDGTTSLGSAAISSGAAALSIS